MHHVGLGGLVRGPDMTPLVLRREQMGDGNGLGSVTTCQEGVGRGIGGTRSRLVGRSIVSVGPTDVFGRTGWVGFTVASRPPRESLAGLGPHGQWDGMSDGMVAFHPTIDSLGRGPMGRRMNDGATGGWSRWSGSGSDLQIRQHPIPCSCRTPGFKMAEAALLGTTTFQAEPVCQSRAVVSAARQGREDLSRA